MSLHLTSEKCKWAVRFCTTAAMAIVSNPIGMRYMKHISLNDGSTIMYHLKLQLSQDEIDRLTLSKTKTQTRVLSLSIAVCVCPDHRV